jgi:rhodanese-related sulfurtransferase
MSAVDRGVRRRPADLDVYSRGMNLSAAAMRTALTGVVVALVMGMSSCATSSEADGKVLVAGAREAVSLIESGEYVVLDLRPERAFEAGHVEGARNLPYDERDFAAELGRLDGDVRYLLYARDPEVADRAADLMVSLDFSLVVDAGSFGLLALAGAPLE